MKRCRTCKAALDMAGTTSFCGTCWYEPFQITSVCRADLQEILSPEAIAKVDVAWLARKLADAYCENGFWIDLLEFEQNRCQRRQGEEA